MRRRRRHARANDGSRGGDARVRSVGVVRARAAARRRRREVSSRRGPARRVRSGTRPRASERGTSSPGDGVKTSAGRSSTKPRPWAVSLARVFEWEDVLEASLEETGDGDGDGDARRDDGDEASTSGARGGVDARNEG